jgi:hypothetical protein
MTTTELITPPRASRPPEPWSDAPRDARPAVSADPPLGEMLAETHPLIGVVPVAGPPVVLVAGPWLLLALMVAGPFALLFTFVLLLVAAAALVGLVGAILTAPFLLVRRVREHRARHASLRAPAAPLVAVGEPIRVVAQP